MNLGKVMGCQSNLAPPTQPPHALLKNKRLQDIRCFRFITLPSFILFSLFIDIQSQELLNFSWISSKVLNNLDEIHNNNKK